MNEEETSEKLVLNMTITFCDWAFAVGSAASAIATFVLSILNTIND